MIVIKKVKKAKKYQMPEMPIFKYRKEKVLWLKRQKKNVTLLNIKNISVQVRDIKQMIYAQNVELRYLYVKFAQQSYYDDEDYITISKYKKGNFSLLYALISADWLINVEDINNKTFEEIGEDCAILEREISELKIRKQETGNHDTIDKRIKLLQYKLQCLSEFLVKQTGKNESQNIMVRSLVKSEN